MELPSVVGNVLLVAVAGMLGTIPTGWLVVRRLRGVDLRTLGSGNIGATNVVRAVGWTAGILTLLIDAFKGALVPLILAVMECDSESQRLAWQILAGIAALGGNIYNPFLGFRGGKGVGTAIGVTAVIAPVPMMFSVIGFAAGFGAARIVSVGSLTAGTAFSVSALVIYLVGDPRPPVGWLAFCVGMGLLVFVTHRSNIRRLLAGQETRLTKQD